MVKKEEWTSEKEGWVVREDGWMTRRTGWIVKPALKPFLNWANVC